MMQSKENQVNQFNTVKENILPRAGLQSKPNQINRSKALQPKMITGNVQNAHNQLSKPAGLKVSKQTSTQNENIIQKSIHIPMQIPAATKPNALQAKSINLNQPAVSKGMQGKINAQKKNANERQSLKSIKNNEIVDGKIKKIERPKANSGSKLNRKVKKANDQSKKEANKSNEQKQQPAVRKDSDCDFVIFCDENDELAIKQVEKESSQVNVEKKKGLAERNVKPQAQAIQVNLQTKTIQQTLNASATVTKTTAAAIATTATIQQAISKTETINAIKSNIEKELIKEAETLMLIDLSKDEELEEIHQETTIDITIENKENDPSLMSIDQSCLNLTTAKEEEIESQCQFKDVSGDMIVKEFSNEIYVYMLERELKFLPDPTYMSKQPDINHKMRAMLVDWLIDVGFEYELNNETVFLAVSYIDQFLSSLTISLQNFQLLGTAALFIAAKYEEIYPPELKDFIFVTDDAYTKLQMLSMEKVILKQLGFNVSPPTIFYFLKYFLTKLSLPVYVEYFAEYLCFLSLLHNDPFLSFSPSDIAISSIILALHTYTLGDVVNLEEFKQLTRIHFCKDEEDKLNDAKAISIRQNCVNALYKLHKFAAEDKQQQAAFTKYSTEKFLSVAVVELADEVPSVENYFY